MVVINLIGFTESEVIPSTAKESIFFSGYLDSPATRSFLTYLTMSLLKPTIGTRPLRNRFTSLNSARASIALLLISL